MVRKQARSQGIDLDGTVRALTFPSPSSVAGPEEVTSSIHRLDGRDHRELLGDEDFTTRTPIVEMADETDSMSYVMNNLNFKSTR